MVNKVLVTDSLLSAVPTLGLVSVTATGVNNVDLEACEKRGVAVTNVPAYSTPSVAQHVIACALDFTNKIHRQSAAVATAPGSTRRTSAASPSARRR